jgi:hypothetical protein
VVWIGKFTYLFDLKSQKLQSPIITSSAAAQMNLNSIGTDWLSLLVSRTNFFHDRFENYNATRNLEFKDLGSSAKELPNSKSSVSAASALS